MTIFFSMYKQCWLLDSSQQYLTIEKTFRAQAADQLFAPLFFPTPFCENRYQNLAALAERCRFICEFSPPFCCNGEKYCIFSILHKGFTVFAYTIRAPPSEI